MAPQPPELGLYLLAGGIFFVFCRYLYRISPLHPLAKIPAPNIFARATHLHDFYWNVIHDGQLIFKIEQWHKELGPIIRIGPNHIHVNDLAFFETAYMSGYKFPADQGFYRSTKGSLDTFLATEQPIHRARRGAMNSIFSKASVNKFVGNIRQQIEKLVNLVEADAKVPGKGVSISTLLCCLAADIVSEYAYGESLKTLDQGSDAPLCSALDIFISWMWVAAWLWPVQFLSLLVPAKLLEMAVPEKLAGGATIGKMVAERADQFMTDFGKAKGKSSHTTVFEALIKSNNPTFKHTRNSIIGDATTIMAAGTATTKETMSTIVFEACLNPKTQQKLHEELIQAFPNDSDEISFANSEKLPYLTAYIKESLRLAPPAPSLLPRVVPKGGTVYDGKFIPGGTSVAVSSYVLHHNPDIFPNPKVFDPERWLQKDRQDIQERGFIPFQKGVRMCIGIHFAYAEVYMTIATLFRRFKFSLHPENRTTREWVDHLGLDRKAELLVSVEEYGVGL